MMKKKGWFWLIISFLLVVVLFVSWQQWGKVNSAKAELTVQEARILVEDRYEGKVKKINLVNNVYEMELTKKNTLYKIQLDAESRQIVSFRKSGTKPKKTVVTSPKERTEEEIRAIVQSAVPGTIVSFEKLESNREVIYRAVVQDIDKQTTVEVGVYSGKILSSNVIPTKRPPTRLTEDQARQMALKQVNGTIDELHFETRGDVSYYLVKVKTSDDQEAIVQIHAITGAVMSVGWDDRGKGKDDKKNDD